MKKILVMGAPFAGKTYLSRAMRELEYNAVDSDYIPNLSVWLDSEGRDRTDEIKKGTNKLDNPPHRTWRIDILSKYLNSQKQAIIIFGWSSNILESKLLFDNIFYLGLTQNELLHRFRNNDREHDYGKSVIEQGKIREIHKYWLKKARNEKIPILRATNHPMQIKNELQKALTR